MYCLLFDLALKGAIRRNSTIITQLHMLYVFANDIGLIDLDSRTMEEDSEERPDARVKE